MRLPTRLDRPKDTETAAGALLGAAVIRQAQRLFGPDYLLRVIAADLPASQRVTGLHRLESAFRVGPSALALANRRRTTSLLR
jgi:hypothetical protein